MRNTKMLIGLLLVLCVACDKSERETPSGLKFKVVKEGNGIMPKEGEAVLFNFVFKDSNDSTWRTTYEMTSQPYIVIRDTSLIKSEDGMSQMIRMLSAGDSVVLSIHIKDFFKDIVRSPIPPQFDTTLTFTYQFKVDSIVPKDSVKSYEQKLYAIQQAKLVADQQAQFIKDTTAIAEYLSKNNIVAQTTELGMRYVITKPGKGPKGVPGMKAEVRYAGYTLEGMYFDTNVKAVALEKGLHDERREPYPTYPVTIDQSQVISGWHEALKLLNKGAKATIFIPSNLAYGTYGNGRMIPPNTVLIFDLEVVDLKNAKK